MYENVDDGLDEAEWEEITRNSKRYVAFVDVLGYGSIVGNKSTSDGIKAGQLHSVFEGLLVGVKDAMSDWTAGAQIRSGASATISAVSFSDCFYFSSDKLGDLVEFVATIFRGVFSYYEQSNWSNPALWMPYLRSGIASGWCLDFLDPTVAHMTTAGGRSQFRNPVGPAIAAAYSLSEINPKLPGMRIVLSTECEKELRGDYSDTPLVHKTVRWPDKSLFPLGGNAILDTFDLFPVSPQESSLWNQQLWEVDWLSPIVKTNLTSSCFNVLRGSERQFGPDAFKHLTATENLMEKSIILAGMEALRVELEAIRERRVAERPSQNSRN